MVCEGGGRFVGSAGFGSVDFGRGRRRERHCRRRLWVALWFGRWNGNENADLNAGLVL